MNIDHRNPLRLTPESIVSDNGGVRFIVPLYQRLFAWSGDEVAGLLADLRFHFEKWPDASPSDPHFPYYFGVITTVPDNERYCLVDGQQRLTVLMIMAAVFSEISPDWKAFFENGNRLELFAREDDARFLKGLGAGMIYEKYRNALMAEAYGVVAGFMAKMDQYHQKLFAARCFPRITLFNSILPPSYLSEPSSLNRYFEVMNSAGVSLEPHEILKVSLLKEQKDQTRLLRIWNLCSDLSTPLLAEKEEVGLEKYSAEYLKLFAQPTGPALDTIMGYGGFNGTPDEIDGRYPTIAETDIKPHKFDNTLLEGTARSVLSFPELLLLTLDIYKNLDGEWTFHKVDSLNRRFEEHLCQHEVPGFYDLLLRLRIALDLYVIRRKIDGPDSEYSLIYRDRSDKAGNDCLEQYEAMLDVSTPYYKWLKVLFRYLLDPASVKTSAAILSALKQWDNHEHPCPASASGLTYGTVDRYWFWRLDYYLWERTVCSADGDSETNRQWQAYRRAIAAYTFRANRSIEHLHPQNEAYNDSWERAAIDSFGNLAMISQSFNSQQSNDDVHVKFSRIESQARNKSLQSLKLLRMYISVKGDPEGWTTESAMKHEAEMMQVLRDSYSV